MKSSAVVALVILGLSIPAFGQNKTSCSAFFQVLRADTQTPQNLRTGMDEAQQRWWKDQGQEKYPGICLDGSVRTGDKPRYLVIWSTSESIEQSVVSPDEVYGQTVSAIRSTAPKEQIYKPTWDRALISIVGLSYTGNLDPAPIRMTTADRTHEFWMDSSKVLKIALQYLAYEEQLSSQQPIAAVEPPAPSSPSVLQPTLTLQVFPTVIQLGESATLNWSSTHATALSLSPSIGNVASEGSISVTPSESTNYTITANGPGGSATATVRITVSFSLKTD